MNRNYFVELKTGKKKVETRAAIVKYRNIKAGDRIEFVCGNERFSRVVRSVKIFKSLVSLLKKYRIADIMPDVRSFEDFQRSYYSYPGYKEKLKKFGIIALTFKK